MTSSTVVTKVRWRLRRMRRNFWMEKPSSAVSGASWGGWGWAGAMATVAVFADAGRLLEGDVLVTESSQAHRL